MGGITLILALLVLGFLIFIHELGHYFMARRAGMRVDAFSIGFGPALIKWKRDGVEWKLSMLPFGGYVKIAGMYDDEGGDPRKIRDGYFAKPPLSRILVAVMGPAVNIAFALLIFTLLWSSGGRQKPFGQYTHRVGWVDPKSALYAKGLRPGDVVDTYEGRTIKSARDHIIAPMIADRLVQVGGYHVNHETGERQAFDVEVERYRHPGILDDGILTAGVMSAANYIVYDDYPDGTKNPLSNKSPLLNSGLQKGDRIFWVDGETIYSNAQLSHILNDGKALLTVERGGDVQLLRVPRLRLLEYALDREHREELTDWQFDSDLRKTDFKNLLFIPYNMTPSCVVEGRLNFLDKADEKAALPEQLLSDRERPLQPGDRIIAVDGKAVRNGGELLKALQSRQVHVIVERVSYDKAIPIEEADAEFNAGVPWSDIQQLALSVGTANAVHETGQFHLLTPIQPVTARELLDGPDKQKQYDEAIQAQKTLYKQQLSGDQLERAMAGLEEAQSRLYLGIPGVQDRTIIYNPPPFTAFSNLLSETFETLRALVSGYLSPKWLAGPVGIVHVIHQQVQFGWADVLFLMAFISQQLGLLNLLPIPILDGGHICFALFEMMSGRQVKQKTMERLTIPFYFLMIGMAIFLTYHDILRLIRSIFGGV